MSRITRILLMVFIFVAVVGGIVGPVQEANAATNLYGRREWELYFTGGFTSGAWPCGGGQLICGGITSTNIDDFVGFYWNNLNSGDVHSHSGAAFTILVMLGIPGPSAGGSVAAGVQNAKNNFATWETTVRSYAAAGRINFSQNYGYTTNTAYRDQPLWHNEASTRIDESIVFTLPNGSQVAIKKACANLVGDWSALPQVANYSLSASSSVNYTQAAPGNRIVWSHSLTNNGPTPTSQNTHSNIATSGISAWGVVGDQDNGAGSGVGVIRNNWGYNLYDVTQDDVGNTLCEWVQFDPTDSSGGRHGRSTAACVAIPYNYTLVPTITNITNNEIIDSGTGNIPIQAQVANPSVTKSHTNIQWQLTQVRYAPGVARANSGGGASPSDPCAYFTGRTACNVLQSGTEAAGYGSGAAVGYAGTGNLGDEPVGTYLCYVMSVRRGSSSSTDWLHSQLYCRVVGKFPKIQVYGGDLIVGRGYTSGGATVPSKVITSTSNKAGTYYGSWGEYAIIPSGQILGMASARGYAVGVGSNALCNTITPLSLLSFTNAVKPPSPPNPASAAAVCSDTKVGKYDLTSPSQVEGIAARFAVAAVPALTGNVNVTSLSSGIIYSGSGAINLSASTDIPAGKWVIINAPEADVRITSDIRYTGATLTSKSQIPQLVIIAKNIVIADNVSNVDSWLFAKGTGADGIVNTCDAAGAEPGNLRSTVCATKLTVNGPVISNHLLLNRTAGSGVALASGDPAEVFNLRPDAYLWASSFSGVGTKARTVMTKELPPRF